MMSDEQPVGMLFLWFQLSLLSTCCNLLIAILGFSGVKAINIYQLKVIKTSILSSLFMFKNFGQNYEGFCRSATFWCQSSLPVWKISPSKMQPLLHARLFQGRSTVTNDISSFFMSPVTSVTFILAKPGLSPPDRQLPDQQPTADRHSRDYFLAKLHHIQIYSLTLATHHQYDQCA